jgi:Methyltransferase domain
MDETSIVTRGAGGLHSVAINSALSEALALHSKLPEPVLQMTGMSGRKYRRFINNLISELLYPRYLEIGSWTGSTACAAMFGNRVRIHCIDNWSQFGGPREHFFQVTSACRSPDVQFEFQEEDYRRVDYTSIGRFNVYMFDGPHEYGDQYDGVRLAIPALDHEFVLIVDDWNWKQVREGTLDAVRDFGLQILSYVDIRTKQCGDGLPAVQMQLSEWHNGYFVAAMRKALNEQSAPGPQQCRPG